MSGDDVNQAGGELKRELGVFGATMMGLGSIVGTGVFVSIGVAAGVIGPGVIVAIGLAACVAVCNALCSAQLAASHPVSGGTYEYGYKYLTPTFGFSAGWMFLCAKSASAATAAIGTAGYGLRLFGVTDVETRRWLAVGIAAAVTGVVLSGMRRSSITNVVIVTVTLVTLGFFVAAGAWVVMERGLGNFEPFFAPVDGGGGSGGSGDVVAEATTPVWMGLLEATALMFVAYTGYGRIATLGEEVREPRRTIPRAIVVTLGVSAALYMAVGAVAVGVLGAAGLSETTAGSAAPLEVAAAEFGVSGAKWVLAVGAVTAMLGVLLNLILGLSRVALAMGRRGDLPAATGKVNVSGTTPVVAVVLVGVIVTGLASLGSVKTAWTFSAFTVLVYYAITNLAALRLPVADRLYPRVFSWTGLIACLGLAFWVDWRVWATGLGVLAVGLVWHGVRRGRGGA